MTTPPKKSPVSLSELTTEQTDFLNFVMRTYGGGGDRWQIEDEATWTKAGIGKKRPVWGNPSISGWRPIHGDRELKHGCGAPLWMALNGCIEIGMHKLCSVAKLDCFSKSNFFLTLYTWLSMSANKNNVIFCSIIPSSGQTSLKITAPPCNSHTVVQTILFMNAVYDVISDPVILACVHGLIFQLDCT